MICRWPRQRRWLKAESMPRTKHERLSLWPFALPSQRAGDWSQPVPLKRISQCVPSKRTTSRLIFAVILMSLQAWSAPPATSNLSDHPPRHTLRSMSEIFARSLVARGEIGPNHAPCRTNRSVKENLIRKDGGMMTRCSP